MYKSKKYFDEGLNFADVFPEKQEILKTTQNFDFYFQEVADFIKINSQDFSVSQAELEAIDKQIEKVVDLWQDKSQPTPTPKSAPEPEPAPEEDEEPTAEQMRQEIEAYTEILAVMDNPEDRAFYESEIDALTIALLYKD
jgi:hypothetical protein